MRAFERQVEDQPHELRRMSSPGGSFVGFQVYFDPAVEPSLDAELNPYFNSAATPFLESQVIHDLIEAGEHHHADYFGVFSWKMKKKVGTNATNIFRLMNLDAFRSDIYTFNFGPRSSSVWECEHPAALRVKIAGDLLLKSLGLEIDLSTLATPLIFQNHFICRSSIYEEYQREFLKPCLEAMKQPSNLELKKLLSQDSQYPFDEGGQQQLQRVFGHPFYTLHPFIAERLFATWVALKKDQRSYRIYRIPTRLGPIITPSGP